MALDLFSYRRGNTPLHHFPALFKIFLLFAICWLSFSGAGNDSAEFFKNPVAVIKLSLSFVFGAVLFVLGGAWWKAFKKMKYILFLGVFVLALRSVGGWEGKLIFNTDGAVSGLLYTARFFITAFCAECIYETTSSLEIKESLEKIENAVSKVIPPVKKLKGAFVISMAISFIPMVFDTWSKVHLAARARSEKKLGFTGTVRSLLGELSALFSCLLFRAETRRKAVINRDQNL